MEQFISAQKIEPIVVQAQPIDWRLNLSNCIYINAKETDEQKYKKEVEYKIKQEFEEFLYESYYKRGVKLDNYIKSKLFDTFRYEKYREQKSFINYLYNIWEKIEDEYF